MAYGMMFPERLVYLYFLFPVKVKYFVAVLGVITFMSAFGSSGSAVAHTAHLGGMVFAFLYLKGLAFNFGDSPDLPPVESKTDAGALQGVRTRRA